MVQVMNKVLSILKYIACVFTGLIALIFAFVEIRPLFAGDFLLMESPALGFIKYLFRALFFLLVISNAIKVFYCVLKKREIDLKATIFNGAVLLGSSISFMFYEWYIALIILVFNILIFVLRVFNKPDISNCQ